ncbi:HWE histidine kinase domain-containing protein [Teichococcus wenyumeiae]|nr:HWE histidine kinase domain-containing protein [Pseudoroseomonas wenyumeiae]
MQGDDASRRSAAPQRRLRPFRSLDALLVAAVLLPALLFGALATFDRSQALATAERDLLATLDTLYGHAEKVIEFQVLALGATDERLRGLSNEAVAANVADHHAYLRALSLYVARIGIVVLGPDGQVLVDSVNEQPPARVSASDREYFRWHQEHPGPEFYVAGLLHSRNHGGLVFFVTRRRSAADGGFLGVTAVGVRQTSFLEYWRSAAVVPGTLVTLSRSDGVLMARWPAIEPGDAVRLPEGGALAQAFDASLERVVVSGTSPLDGIDRLVAYRHLGHFPVSIAVGIPKEAALAGWYRRVTIYGGFAVMTSLALCWLCLLARRRTQELRQLNAHLEERVRERTAAIQASESQVRLLAREVDHRAKNALAVVQATLQLTPKKDLETYVEAVAGRVSALARAQALLSQNQWRGASLQALLKAELTPFVSEAGGEFNTRAELDGLAVLLPPAAAQPLAMAMHELATNALKHGALSVPGGQATVSWRLSDTAEAPGDLLILRWEESKGPLVKPPTRRGFGFRMLEAIVRGQLGGRLSLSWLTSGFVCEIEMSLTRPGRASEEGALKKAG